VDKLLIFPGKTDRGIFTYVIDAERNYLEKTAGEYHPTIAAYINQAKTIKGKTQLLITALGAGEWWGDNANSDFFTETGLAHEGPDYGYKTFEMYANIFKHHINKDPLAAYGKVALAVYNPTFHRVELIVIVDNARAPDIVAGIEIGEYPDWSMGTRVPFDICSICGNKAPTRKQYCEHARYMLGKIHPETGKKIYVINTMPKFFDISVVLIGADRIAKTLRKVASYGTTKSGLLVPSSALLAEKMAASDKEAEIEKEVPADRANPPASTESLDTLVRSIPEVKAYEPELPKMLLDEIAKRPFGQSMSTMSMMGILPKPQEFQRIVLIQLGHKPLADELWSKNECFDPNNDIEPTEAHERALGLGAENFNSDIMRMLEPFMERRSYAAPHLLKRLTILVKRANYEPLPIFFKVGEDTSSDERKPIGALPVLMTAAALYWALARKAPKETLIGLDKVIAEHPGLAAALGLGSIAMFNAVSGPKERGQMSAPPENPDANDVFARINEQRQKPFYKVAFKMGPAAKRLFLGIPAAYMASGVLQKQKEVNPYHEEGSIRKFVRKYPDLISGALVADAMLATQGRGTAALSKHLGKLSPFQKAAAALEEIGVSDPLVKSASVSDAVKDSLIWNIAVGGRNLPGRVLGGLIDQSALELGGNILGKRKKEGAVQGSGSLT
jgi:hypothetical protein